MEKKIIKRNGDHDLQPEVIFMKLMMMILTRMLVMMMLTFTRESCLVMITMTTTIMKKVVLTWTRESCLPRVHKYWGPGFPSATQWNVTLSFLFAIWDLETVKR